MDYHINIDDYFEVKKEFREMWTEYAEGLVENYDNLILVAIEDDKIIGVMDGRLENRAPIYKIEKIGRIGTNFVLPEYRSKGVFTCLLDEMLKWMEKKGVEYVEHPIAAKNKLGRTVWKKKGFEDSTVFTRRKISI